MIEHLIRRDTANAAPQPERSEEGEVVQRPLQELSRRDLPIARDSLEPAYNTGSDVERVVGASVDEIESLIEELKQLRDFLNQEGLYVQREIEGFERLTDEVTTSTKIILESVAHLKV
jgi:hypothetical protein